MMSEISFEIVRKLYIILEVFCDEVVFPKMPKS
jgi:hypothetical protein